MSMFINYDNTPSSYIPNTISKKNPVLSKYPPVKPMELRNAKDELIGYTWNYGDTVVLDFNISGNVYYDDNTIYETIASYMSTGDTTEQFEFRIFNDRFECIYVAKPPFHIIGDKVNCAVFIYDTLSEILVKGIYYLQLVLVGQRDNPSYDPTDPDSKEKISIIQTLFKPEQCTIVIK